LSLAVVDTNVVSMLFKSRPEARFYESYLVSKEPAVSFMTIAELNFWPLVGRWGIERIEELNDFLADFTVLPCTDEVCIRWADLTYEARSAGRPISCADAWIAATALVYGAVLLTHNVKDFAGLSSVDVISGPRGATETGSNPEARE
jgi:predicted nucleic acid-binding protein